tara:strand:- start:34 stop:726 length:693 start_codon:yes stop_codon:yes gene_type:complete
MKHYAIIPARKNSKGLKYKNRKLIKYTSNFLKKLKWFNKIIISTDDEHLIKKCENKNYLVHNRSKFNSRSNSSILSVMKEIQNKYKFSPDDFFWLFYITIPQKKVSDYNFVRKILSKKKLDSVISVRPVLTHPDDCWILNNKKLTKYTKNKVYRRQDKKELYEHYHYICAFRINKINSLNDELIGKFTYPLKIKNKFKENLIEIDCNNDYQKFLSKIKNEKINSYIEQNF